MEAVGQILGFIAFGIAFAVYQMKDKKSLLIVQTMLVCVASLHYFCLKAYPAMAMNMIGIVRNLIYYRKDIFKQKYIPAVVSAAVMAAGILTASDMWSILVIVGLTVNSYCLSLENIQHFRISILFTSTLVLIYNIVVFSIGGMLLESISILSAVIGLFRNRKMAKSESKNTLA